MEGFLMDEQMKKVVRAKLFNMKSSVEGLISIVENSGIGVDVVVDSVSGMAAKFVDECSKLDCPRV
jgi:hypothetical protein